MSFLDDDDFDERPPGTSRAARSVAPADRQQLMARRAVAAGAGLVVLILLLLGIRGCLESRKQSALRDYVASVNQLAQESAQGSQELFALLDDPGDRSPLDFENAIKSSRSGAASLVDRAEDTSVPGDMEEAHDAVLLTLELRRDGLQEISDLVGTALGREGRQEATDQIAAQMQAFLASDVIYSQRALPAIRAVLGEEDLTDERVAQSRYVPDIEWLSPDRVSDSLSRVRGDSDTVDAPEGAIRGTALLETVLNPGGVALQPGGAATIPAEGEITVQAQVQNQGEVDERDIVVVVRITGADEPIEVEKTLSSIAQGETAEVNVPISPAPPTGQPLEMEVTVEPLPGEEVVENNTATFTVTFE